MQDTTKKNRYISFEKDIYKIKRKLLVFYTLSVVLSFFSGFLISSRIIEIECKNVTII
jgi:hypothetical protein